MSVGQPRHDQAKHKGQREPKTFTQWFAGQRGGRGPHTILQVQDLDEAAASVGCLSLSRERSWHPKTGRWQVGVAAQHQASGLALEVSRHSPGWDLAGVLKNLYRVKGGGAPVVWGRTGAFPSCSLKLWLAHATFFNE